MKFFTVSQGWLMSQISQLMMQKPPDLHGVKCQTDIEEFHKFDEVHVVNGMGKCIMKKDWCNEEGPKQPVFCCKLGTFIMNVGNPCTKLGRN